MEKAINNWLLQYEAIKEIAEIIPDEKLSKETNYLKLQRNGVESLPLKYVGEKGWYRQYKYILLLKSNSEDDLQKLNNLVWLDNLNDWIAKQNKLKNFPEMDNKKVEKVSCANSIICENVKDSTTNKYYIQLYFNIKGGILK